MTEDNTSKNPPAVTSKDLTPKKSTKRQTKPKTETTKTESTESTENDEPVVAGQDLTMTNADEVDTTPVSGNSTSQNIKLTALLRDYVEKLDNLAVASAVMPAGKTASILQQMANELEVEVSIIVGS